MARNYSSTAPETQLSSPVSGSATVVPVSSVSGFPPVPFTLVLDPGTVYEELITVTGIAGLNLTAVRGEDGTSGVAHQTGAVVRHVVSARDLREGQQHMDASQDVHGIGVGSAVVGTNKAQVLKNKTIDSTNSVQSGALPTETTVARLRVTSTSDASTSSTTHGLQIGDTSGDNLRMDTNEILGVSGGSPTPVVMPTGVTMPTFSPSSPNDGTTKRYVDGTVVSGAIGSFSSGWTVGDTAGDSYIKRAGKDRTLFLEVRRQGSGIVVGANGHIADEPIRVLDVGDRPAFRVVAAGIYRNSGGGNYACTLQIETNGEVVLSHATGGADITYQDPGNWSLRVYASYPVS